MLIHSLLSSLRISNFYPSTGLPPEAKVEMQTHFDYVQHVLLPTAYFSPHLHLTLSPKFTPLPFHPSSLPVFILLSYSQYIQPRR